jgi:hypothetical protein
MAFGWPATLIRGVPLPVARVDTGTAYYIGLAVLVAILIVVLIAAYRTWEEIRDVEDPDSPADLLESFQQAHQQGELDEYELDRVRRLLSASQDGAGMQGDASSRRGQVVAGDGPENPEE